MNKTFIVMLSLAAAAAAVQSCKKDETSKEDEALFAEIATANSYYQNAAVLSPAGNSPHGNFKLRFNGTANAALDSTGELPTGSSLPTGSVIVKEVVSNGAASLYAVMKKDPGSVYAGSGWLWAEYNPDGSTVISVTKKGADGECVSCHAFNTNRDLTNTFDLH